MIGDKVDNSNDWDLTHSYDRSTEEPSVVVVRAVAGTTNQPTCSIEPLYTSIDPEALDAFIDDEDRSVSTWLSFFYEGCRVHVDAKSVSVSLVDEEVAE